MTKPIDLLRHYVTGAIERGEAEPIVEITPFENAIATMWPNHVIAPSAAPGCVECFPWLEDCSEDALTESDLDMANEGSFSWSDCDGCGSPLGGTRYNAHAIHREAFGPNAKRPNDVTHINICEDCLCFHANGDIPKNWEG